MELTAKLQKQIEKKESEITALEAERDAIQKEIDAGTAYINGIKDAIKTVTRDASASDKKTAAPRAVKVGSATDKAQKALLKANRALHINELVDAMGVENTKQSRINIASTISQNVKTNRIFTRPEANTFGLIQWEDREPNEDDEQDAWLESLTDEEYESHERGGMQIN